MAKNKKSLLIEAAKASRIQQVLSSNGWKDIEEIIQNKYDSLMNDLLERENPEARGGINAITEIMNDIQRDISFGETARKKYSEQYLRNNETL
jgi:hypothetical protein